MIVAALDFGTALGLAVDGPKEFVPICRTIDLPRAVKVGRPEHFYAFSAVIHDVIAEYKPQVLAFETPMAMGGKSGFASAGGFELAFGYAAIVQAISHQHDLQCVSYPVATIRAHFLGTGRPPKGQGKRMVMERCRQLGWQCSDFNASDSAALWDTAKSKLRGAHGAMTTDIVGSAA